MPFNKKAHHNFGEIRTRFVLRAKLISDEVKERLENYVNSGATVLGKAVYS